MKMSGAIREIGLTIGQCFNVACLFIISIVWRIDILGFILLVFLVSFAFGAVIANLARTVAYNLIAIIAGTALAVAFFALPQIMFAETESIMLVLSYIGRLLLIGMIVYFVGAFLGSFLVEMRIEKSELESTP